MERHNQTSESDEINFIELIRTVWKNRKTIIIIGIVFTLLGIIFALNSTNIYTASTTFIPKGQSNTSVGGNLSGLASLAGINLGGGMNGGNTLISATLYPMIVKSNPFIETDKMF